MEKEYLIKNFEGGLNDTLAPIYLEDNCLSECQNANLSFDGGIGKRSGTDIYLHRLLKDKNFAADSEDELIELKDVRFIFAKEVMINGYNRIFFIARYVIPKESLPDKYYYLNVSNYYFGYIYADKDFDVELEIEEFKPCLIKQNEMVHFYDKFYRAITDNYIIGKKVKRKENDGKWSMDHTDDMEGYCYEVYDTTGEKDSHGEYIIDDTKPDFSNEKKWEEFYDNPIHPLKDERGYYIFARDYELINKDISDISFAQTEKGLYFSFSGKFYRISGFDFTSDEGIKYIVKNSIVKVNHEEASESVYGKYYLSLKEQKLINLITANYNDTSLWKEINIDKYRSEVPMGIGDYDYTYLDGTVNKIYMGEVILAPRYYKKYDSASKKNIWAKDTSKLFRYRAKRDIMGFDSDGNQISFGLSNLKYYDTSLFDNISNRATKYDEDGDGETDDNISLDEVQKCTMMIYHPYSKRIFAAGHPKDKKAVFYSDPGEFNVFRRSSTLYPASTIGNVTAMTVIKKYLCVSYEQGWYVFSGGKEEYLDEFVWQPLSLPYGALNNKCVISTPCSFTFFTGSKIIEVNDRIFADIGSLEALSIYTKIISDGKVNTSLSNIKNKKLSAMAFNNGKVYLAFNDDNELDYANKLMEYDFEKSTGFNINTGLVIYYLFNKNSKLFIGSKNYIIETDIFNKENSRGLSDFNPIKNKRVPIEFKVVSKPYDLSEFYKYKHLKRIMPIYLQNYDMEGESNLNIKITGEDTKEISLDLNLSDSLIWGRKWGNIWGFSDIMYKYIETDLTSINFKFSLYHNSFDDMMILLGFGFIYETLKSEVGYCAGDEQKLMI